MALRLLNPCPLMRKNAQSVLGLVCLLAWLVPAESWAQSSLQGASSNSAITTQKNANPAQLAAARKFWIYAAMSQNVYREKQIGLPMEWTSEYPKSGVSGFYAETFVKREKGKITAIVIAFRGTDGRRDWALGNAFNIQQGAASNYATAVLGKYGLTPELTGHSLGGALAQNVANNLEIRAIVFDSSPADGAEDAASRGGKIFRVYEEGEALDRLRVDKLADVKYNFINNQEGEVGNHAMYPLAKGMKELAAGNQDATPLPVTNAPPAIDNASTNTTSGLSGDEVAKVLGPTKEHDRAAAIAQMVKQGAIRSPLAANELATILKGTTGGNRSYAIAQLGALIKSRLTAQEAATVLGTVNELREHDRAAAIQSIAKANSYAELTGDAALILEGTTGGNRSFAIAELAIFFKKGLSASAVSEALGSVQQLREHDRAAAIQALVRASVPGLWGGEASESLNGCTGGNRSFAIAQLAPRLRANLTGMEVSSILGQPEELREHDRAAAIQSLVTAKRLRMPFSGDELSLVLTGTTGGNRSYAIGLLTTHGR